MSEKKITLEEGYKPEEDKGYQPTGGNLDPKNPPGWGSTDTDSSNNQGGDKS